VRGGFDGSRGGEKGNQDGLPERKEDDEFDGGDFEEGLVLAEIVFHLDVKLDEAVHGYADADALNDHYLGVSAEGSCSYQG